MEDREETKVKVAYFRETDSMYITLRSDTKYEESEEVAPGVVLDFDKGGNVVSIEIYSGASEKVDLSRLEVEGLTPHPGTKTSS